MDRKIDPPAQPGYQHSVFGKRVAKEQHASRTSHHLSAEALLWLRRIRNLESSREAGLEHSVIFPRLSVSPT